MDGAHESGMPQEEEVKWQVRIGEGEGHAKVEGRSTEVKTKASQTAGTEKGRRTTT